MGEKRMRPGYLFAQYELNDPKILSVVDDMPLWSAPFGLKLLEVVRYRKHICVLDIGTGLGFPLVELAMRLGSTCHIIGLDPWKPGLERAKLKKIITGCRNIELVHGAAEAMPFENASFDLIISNNGLNNVHDLRKSLCECSRVAKKGAQLVFTYNTDRTFHEFYNLFRKSLRASKLNSCLKNVDRHIYSKRKPLTEYKATLVKSGFIVKKVYKNFFSYRFNDGTSMLNHFSIKLSFLPAWKEFIPEKQRVEVFSHVEERMNRSAEKTHGFTMSVPFVTIDCQNGKG
jgi:ubiquinone/menaquinone biosynthesis C-methylase UbiE